MIDVITKKDFVNGSVYLAKTKHDSYPLEITDTYLPEYTKYCIGGNTNRLRNDKIGSRLERWMIGVSVMSGCPVGCKFCATGALKKYRNLSVDEIVSQVLFVIRSNPEFNPNNAKEFKINYTRMGEPFLNIDNVKAAIKQINSLYPNTHHFISTIGISNSDFSWIEGNITLQLSLHSLIDDRRNFLIPFKSKLSIEELGKIRVNSNLKITINLTLVDKKDFDIDLLRKYFDPNYFFIKLSPINYNEISNLNNLGAGVIISKNIK